MVFAQERIDDSLHRYTKQLRAWHQLSLKNIAFAVVTFGRLLTFIAKSTPEKVNFY